MVIDLGNKEARRYNGRQRTILPGHSSDRREETQVGGAAGGHFRRAGQQQRRPGRRRQRHEPRARHIVTVATRKHRSIGTAVLRERRSRQPGRAAAVAMVESSRRTVQIPFEVSPKGPVHGSYCHSYETLIDHRGSSLDRT